MISFVDETKMNAVLIQEHIALGQRVKGFSIEVGSGEGFREVASGTTIGNRRILRFDMVAASELRINIRAKACPIISNIEVYATPEVLE